MKTIIKDLDVIPNSSGPGCFLAGWASGTAREAEIWSISYKLCGDKLAANAEYVGVIRGDEPMPRAKFQRFVAAEWLDYTAPEPGNYFPTSLRLKGSAFHYSAVEGGDWSVDRINAEAALIAAIRANHHQHDTSGQLFRGPFASALDDILAAPNSEFYDRLDNLRALASSEVVEMRWHSMHGEYPVYRIDGIDVPAAPAFWSSPFQEELKRRTPTRTWGIIELLG